MLGKQATKTGYVSFGMFRFVVDSSPYWIIYLMLHSSYYILAIFWSYTVQPQKTLSTFTIKVLEKSSLDSQDTARVETSDEIFGVEINRIFVEQPFQVVGNLKRMTAARAFLQQPSVASAAQSFKIEVTQPLSTIFQSNCLTLWWILCPDESRSILFILLLARCNKNINLGLPWWKENKQQEGMK